MTEVTTLEQVTFDAMVRAFAAGDDLHDELHMRGVLINHARMNEATHLVLFRNLQMDSSAFGRETMMCIGPTCTYKSIDDVRGKHLNDLPSQRQYPVMFCVAP